MPPASKFVNSDLNAIHRARETFIVPGKPDVLYLTV